MSNKPLTKQTQLPVWHTLTLAEYVHLRNGVPLGHTKSLSKMLQNSFGANSLAQFWQYWNPIWGYGLGKYIYTPLQKIIPSPLALLLTFIFSGMLHDLVAMIVRRDMVFLFTPWFFFVAVGVAIGKKLAIDFSTYSLWGRAGIHLIYLSSCLLMALWVSRVLLG